MPKIYVVLLALCTIANIITAAAVVMIARQDKDVWVAGGTVNVNNGRTPLGVRVEP